MSLIPWEIGGDNPTIIHDVEPFRPDGNAVLILGSDDSELTEKRNTNISYDLRVGQYYVMYRDRKVRCLDDTHKSFLLPPREAAIIYTIEQVHFPDTIFGLIVPKHTLLVEGLSNWPTKVDPGYGVDSLHVTVFNHSTKPYKLTLEQRFCALCLFDIQGKHARPRAKGTIGVPTTFGRPGPLRVWIQNNFSWKWAITILIASGTLIWQIIDVLI